MKAKRFLCAFLCLTLTIALYPAAAPAEDATPPDAPVITSPGTGSITNQSHNTVSGTAEPNSSVTLYADDSAISLATADGAGNWTINGLFFSDNSYSLKAKAKDAAGNESAFSDTNTFTVDTLPPAAPVITAPANGSSTSDSTPAISGTAEANSTVTIYMDGSAQGTASAGGDGGWSFVQPASLADAAHTVKAKAADAAGNTGPDSNMNTFTVDTTPPAAPNVITPENGSITNDSTPACTGTAVSNSTVNIFIDGSAIGTAAANAGGSWSFTLSSPLNDGSHAVKASASDWLGNTSADSTANVFTVDTTPPAAPVILTPANGSAAHVKKPFLSGTAEPDSVLTVYVDGIISSVLADGAGNWLMPSTNLADGPHTVWAAAVDAAGNTGPDSGTNSFTVDTSALPVTQVTAPVSGSVANGGTPVFSGTAEPKYSVEIYVDGASIGSATANAEGGWSLNAPSALNDGPHTVYAEMYVATQRIVSVTNTFTVDTLPPAAPIVTAPANGSSVNNTTPSITGSAEALSTVTVMLDGSIAGTATADGAGDWSFTPAAALAMGNHTMKVSARDAAGNIGPYSSDTLFAVWNLPVTISAITGVTAPVKGAAPVMNITETDEYTGTVSWSPSISRFRPDTVYTATISLSAKNGYTFSGAAKDFFQVSGAAASNDAGSGVIRAVFPATASFINAQISPASCIYDLSAPTDAAVQITFHDALQVTDLLLGAKSLPSPAGYTVNGNVLTIKSGYLAGLNPVMGDTLNFTAVFDAGLDCALNVTVTDSAALHDATLTQIKAGGAAVAGFSADITAYTVELPYGTPPDSALAAITALPSRPGAKVSIARAAVLPGDAVVTVTAMDEATVRTYTVRLTLAQPVSCDVVFCDRDETHAVRTVLAGASIGGALWPANPGRNGYNFGGWFTGQDGAGSAFTAETAVNAPMNVYAKWTVISPDSDTINEIMRSLSLRVGSETDLASLFPAPGNTGRQILTLDMERILGVMRPGFQISATFPMQPPSEPIEISDNVVDMLSRRMYSSMPPTSAYGIYDSVAALQFPSGLVTEPSLLSTLACNTDMGIVTLPSNLLVSGATQGAASNPDAVLTFMSGYVGPNPGVFDELTSIRTYYVGLTVGGQQVTQTDSDVEMSFYFATHGRLPGDPEDYSVIHLDENGTETIIPDSHYDPRAEALEFCTSMLGLYALVPQR